jgi:decaprenyl-phosphate phosphoribosyltransferase
VSSVELSDVRATARGGVWPYVQIARVDHWFKNSFMILGVVLAIFYRPDLLSWGAVPWLVLAVASTCLVASSNYTLNELLDGPMDALHPEKRFRPVPSGRVKPLWAYMQWIALAAAGLAIARQINLYFALSALSLWVMGVLYNVPPIRTKEWPYVDVLSESVNNPIRLMLGWFALIDNSVPPVSLMLSYWMIGAFFMAMKRYAELRHIGDRRVAAAYRRSFAYYTESSLLVSILFYATSCALFGGIFIVRYHIELILFVPFAAGLFSYYLSIGMLPNSPTQHPEHLYKQKAFVAYLIVCFVMFVGLMFVQIPALYRLFNVEPSTALPLWRLG